eukprot:m51a1_g452 hypothetical protein (256) ;mRNA; f:140982-141859
MGNSMYQGAWRPVLESADDSIAYVRVRRRQSLEPDPLRSMLADPDPLTTFAEGADLATLLAPYLSLRDLGALQRVSLFWYRTARRPDLWRQALLNDSRRWPPPAREEVDKLCAKADEWTDWKQEAFAFFTRRQCARPGCGILFRRIDGGGCLCHRGEYNVAAAAWPCCGAAGRCARPCAVLPRHRDSSRVGTDDDDDDSEGVEVLSDLEEERLDADAAKDTKAADSSDSSDSDDSDDDDDGDDDLYDDSSTSSDD